MVKKILKIIAVILLILLVFPASNILVRYSPYFNGNSLGSYIIACLVYAAAAFIIVLLITNKDLSKPLFAGGMLLFFCGLVMSGIGGLGAPPDFSPAMLQHPEREHYRYTCLLICALLFTAAFLIIIKSQWNVFPQWNRWILLFVIPAIAELFWEFTHHYFYAENLQAWIEQGKNAAGFAADYDNMTGIKCGAIGRCFQYTVVAWLALILLQRRLVKTWAFIAVAFFCLLGVISGISIFVTSMHLPKSMEILFIFFIPGIPFILLYWTGIAVLTTTSKKPIK
ncbi:MAG: hypothetical protein QM791_03085 [Ferruginibacter sp.]